MVTHVNPIKSPSPMPTHHPRGGIATSEVAGIEHPNLSLAGPEAG